MVTDENVERGDGGQDLVVDRKLAHAEALELVRLDDGDEVELWACSGS